MIANTKTTRCLPATLGAAAVATLFSLTLSVAPAQDREQEKPAVRESDGNREKTEAPERDGDRERAEAHAREDRERAEARAREDREKAEAREREDHERAEARERGGDRERAEARERDRAELNRAREQEIRAVQERIGMLAREGKREEAEALEQRLRAKLQAQAEGRLPEHPVEARPANPDDLRRHIVELTEMVRQMQHSMNEMREQIQLLRQGQEARRSER